ncbi:FAD-binding protein [Streptomyces sp. NPDC056230]|uniref:FAD-binding protein n=1 Tax=Streptomyces sp. NPDC056230 TaxID=3345754 RepID=UPI0035D8EA1D
MAAAFEAASAGADVLVPERAGGPGGSSALSNGELYPGGGTPVQQACGFEDSAGDMFACPAAALGPHADEEKLRLYCDGSTEHFPWFVDRGLTFEPTLWDAPTWRPATRDGLMRLGYMSGTSLGDGTFFGCRAGVAAAGGARTRKGPGTCDRRVPGPIGRLRTTAGEGL